MTSESLEGLVSTSTRWWIPGPGADESLRSIVERADRMYGHDQDGLRRHLWPRATLFAAAEAGLDALNARDLCALARAIGVPPRSLFLHRLPDHPLLLLERERRAYCPACWREDLAAGRPVAFRRAWASFFSLNCAVHGVPLHWASPMNNFSGESGTSPPNEPSTARGKRTLRFIEIFGKLLEDALCGRTTWPKLWRGDALSARAMLMRSVVNLGCAPEHPPIANITTTTDLGPFIGKPLRRIAPLQDCPWDQVRALGRPAWRRGALWITARAVMPAANPDYLPEGFVDAAFSAIDAQWDVLPKGRQLRRVRRYRAALRGMCKPFAPL